MSCLAFTGLNILEWMMNLNHGLYFSDIEVFEYVQSEVLLRCRQFLRWKKARNSLVSFLASRELSIHLCLFMKHWATFYIPSTCRISELMTSHVTGRAATKRIFCLQDGAAACSHYQDSSFWRWRCQDSEIKL